ncbi:Hypothetical protein FKW44_010771 [Caligus rogercresseyi]|uniref:Uncharacterized protein n=1 Tax=Caligus rogercresseyi TaxID=217165 RepID=A0A7T8HH21_CALRO|nr:Hypothetical protein FKW44_010771 [Caligus rogercresseyi]
MRLAALSIDKKISERDNHIEICTLLNAGQTPTSNSRQLIESIGRKPGSGGKVNQGTVRAKPSFITKKRLRTYNHLNDRYLIFGNVDDSVHMSTKNLHHSPPQHQYTEELHQGTLECYAPEAHQNTCKAFKRRLEAIIND